MLRDTLAASVVLAGVAIAAGAVAGRFSAGIGLGAGLVVGSINGRLVLSSLEKRLPFVAASLGRMALISVAAIAVAALLGSSPWSVLLGVGAAQAVMVAAAIRQGLRA